MGLYLVCKRVYRSCVPSRVRGWLLDPANPMAGVLYPLKRVLERTAGHDEIYDANYYNHVDNVMNESNEVIANSIVSTFGPKAILDVGCGTGALLMALTRRGVKTSGLEYSYGP